ncbi:ankyrin repeat domain-containing protein [Wolbachia endosymbiont (group E) of Neria commutata]|uniref:ankyrin repeat domain-containing protein n=1 Tax=Wolbachia endosymbiont (group E) of Neria commutata TaxID=3066149 RepID=UPI003132DBC6
MTVINLGKKSEQVIISSLHILIEDLNSKLNPKKQPTEWDLEIKNLFEGMKKSIKFEKRNEQAEINESQLLCVKLIRKVDYLIKTNQSKLLHDNLKSLALQVKEDEEREGFVSRVDNLFSKQQNINKVQENLIPEEKEKEECKELFQQIANLIQTVEDINIKNEDGKSALHLAAEYGIVQLVKQLLQREGQEITKDVILEELRNSAQNITGNDKTKATRQKKKFLEKTDINCQDHNGKTPLHYAVENGHKEVIELLHNAGARTLSDKNGRTPLYPAAEKGYIEVLKLLLGEIDTRTLEERVKQFSEDFYKAPDERKKDTLSRKDQKKIVDHVNQYGQALLHLAAQNGHFEVVNFLVQKGASLEIKDNSCKTPLEYAIESLKALDKLDKDNKEKIIQFINIIKLLTNQPLQNIKGYLKETDLHALAKNGASKDELALLLKNKGIDINSKNILGQTALHIAVLSGNTKMVGYLLEEGADPSQQDVFGNTALHYAVPCGDVTSIKLLRKHGADSTIINLLGKKPIDLIVDYTEQNKDKKNKKPHLLLGLTGIVLIGIGFSLYYSIQIAQHDWYITAALGVAGLIAGLLVSIVINEVVQRARPWYIESSMRKELELCQEKSNELGKEGFIPTQVEQPSKGNGALDVNSGNNLY